MTIEPQIDPPAELTTSTDATEFQHMIYLGLPIRLRGSATGRWLLLANEYNELHVGDHDDRMACRVTILAALATICAQFETTLPGFGSQ